MKEERIITQFQRLRAMDAMIGIPELTEAFHEDALAILEEMKEKRDTTNKTLLVDLINRQTAFLNRLAIISCNAGRPQAQPLAVSDLPIHTGQRFFKNDGEN